MCCVLCGVCGVCGCVGVWRGVCGGGEEGEREEGRRKGGREGGKEARRVVVVAAAVVFVSQVNGMQNAHPRSPAMQPYTVLESTGPCAVTWP